ncbi:MAG: DNA translocase FtsK [Peptococcaceae bacterium]|nr:DNA translocase FtsK [Peptococcaceae bacterium]
MDLKLLGKILVRSLAFIYLVMAAIGFLGYFGLEKFSAGIFAFFNNFMGKYALILPFVCLVFTVVCWKISGSEGKAEEDDDDLYDIGEPLEERPAKHSGRDKKRNQFQSLEKTPGGNGFPSYFSGNLTIRDNGPINKDGLENLGTNFSTYFGQGEKNIYMPAKTVDLQGFRDYFRDRSTLVKEYDQAANDTVRRENNLETESKVLPKKYPFPPVTIQMKEPKSEILPVTMDYREEKGNDLTLKIKETTKQPSWILPGLDLLFPKKIENASEQHNPKLLEDVLSTFGVTAKVIHISTGPVTTRYELSPAPGTKISKIVNLADDIALAMASRDIRIEAPIPGKAAVGIEIPRKNPRTVYFREVIDSENFRGNKAKLKMVLGKDIADTAVIGQLEKMPHLLVAGATGSGKSIFINCLINSLLYTVTPDEVKLLLIDPKMVELNQYNGIPHLLTPVVTDPKKANKYLKYIVREMENRYELFASSGVRDIDHYNKSTTLKKLPYIVVVIDELADLMMVASNEIEEAICRLAQMARAAGIHLVIATQRPSVNVITGLIKANIPSRISFAVSSQIDSRTILDAGGAEKLLGKGDMLYSPIGLSKPLRVHGCYIDEQEVKNVIEHWKSQGKPQFGISEEQLEESVSVEKKDEELDDRFMEAAELVISSGVASVSFLQRRLRVGYSRAARLMDMLEEAGVVGRSDGNKPRDILMSLDTFNQSYCS